MAEAPGTKLVFWRRKADVVAAPIESIQAVCQQDVTA
jgi:hypothetical protein